MIDELLIGMMAFAETKEQKPRVAYHISDVVR